MARVEETLKELGAQSVCVPGAKLHAEVSKRAAREDLDFGEYLRAERITFRQFLARSPSIQIHTRPKADMLVGFPGASLPATARRFGERGYSRLRPDVYRAFTRISAAPFLYVRGEDRFTTEPTDELETAQVPFVTLEHLIEHRRRFAESIQDNDEAQEDLLRSIERSANPLADFQRTLLRWGVAREWHQFNLSVLRGEIESWAKENDLPMSEAWYAPPAEAELENTPLDVLVELARHMTEEEIRSLAVPFRAVEELYRARPHRPEP